MDNQILNCLDDGVIITDINGNLVQHNPAAEKLLPLSNCENLTQVITNPKFIDHFTKKTTDPIQIHYNQKKWFSITIKPLNEQQNIIIIKDITHITHLERMRKDFVANVSHELRTPLTVIQGYLELLLELDNNKNTHQWLEQMQHQGNRMQELVEGLLKLSQLENKDDVAADKEQISVTQLVNTIIHTTLQPINPITFTCHCDDNLILQGNTKDIQSVLSNLIANAIKYSPNGGQITITWELVNEKAIFSVKDQGLGIAPKHIPRITERFYRVDKARSYSLGPGGTGLGLAIVKHILIQHQAKLEVTSELHQGSEFRCVFPKHRILLSPIDDNQPHTKSC